MDGLACKIAERFLWLDNRLLKDLGIIAVVLSGSVLYCHAENDTLDQARDLDMAMIVPSARELAVMLGKERAKLMRLLCMAEEEHPEIQWPSNIRWRYVDGIRFAGFDSAGLKRSAKILTRQAFDRSDGLINLLSKKDRRVYEGFTFAGAPVRRLQPATKVGNGLVILHDPWLFQGNHTVDVQMCKSHASAFGVTADLLLTGFWVCGEQSVGPSLRRTLIDFAAERTCAGLDPTTTTFARSPRFGKLYREWLAGQWEVPAIADGGHPERRSHKKVREGSSTQLTLYGPAGDSAALRIESQIDPIIAMSSHHVFSRAVRLEDCILLKALHQEHILINGRLCNIKVFCKQSSQQRMIAERKGAVQASKYFPYVQQPKASDSCLIYPVFAGRSEAEMQLELASAPCLALRDSILDVEMRKAEDMLRAYCNSTQDAADLGRSSSPVAIDRFYRERLCGDSRLRLFYSSGIFICGTWLSLDKLCHLKLRINGRDYSSLRTVLDDATDCLMSKQRLLAFGLGDGHGGNVLVPFSSGPDPARKLLSIDYEVSGFHSPLLDLAKPLYNDIFFRALYADCISSPPQIEVELMDDTLLMRTFYGDSSLAQAILGVKRSYLVEPLFRHAQELGFDLYPEARVLSSALFACGLLTRDFSKDMNAFLINLCISAVLAGARKLDDIWAGIDDLLVAEGSTCR